MFIVEAVRPEDAQSWGDHLSKDFASRSRDIFLWSSIEPYTPAVGHKQHIPAVPYGVEVSDDLIGW